MKIKKSILLPLAVAGISIASLAGATNVHAVTPDFETNDSFNVTRTIYNAYGITDQSFTYTLEADPDNPDNVDVPTTCTTSVVGSMSTFMDLTSDFSDCVFDFSSTDFTVNGIYNWTLSEEASTNPTYPRDDKIYNVKIQIRDGAGSGKIATMYVYEDGAKLSLLGQDNNPHFASTAKYTKTIINTTTAGGAGNAWVCFEYVVSMPNQNIASFTLNPSGTICEGNPNYVSDGTSIFMRHGDTFVIGESGDGQSQIPIGQEYTIAIADNRGYTTTWDGTLTPRSSVTKITAAIDDVAFNESNVTHITNTLEEEVITGIAMTVVPYVVLALLAMTGAAVAIKAKKTSKR